MIDPTKAATAVSKYRMRFLRLYSGATDEQENDSVPAANREKFRERVAFNKQWGEAWFERVCNGYGATDGTWSTVPEDRRTAALAWVERKNADYENRCRYELDLLRIELEEQHDAALAP